MTDEKQGPLDDEELAQRLVDQAEAEGVSLTGLGGLLGGLTKRVLETALAKVPNSSRASTQAS